MTGTNTETMDRREFVYAAGGVAVSAALAGCSLPGQSDGETTVSETVVRDVPGDEDDGGDYSVTETASPHVAVNGVIFQRAGQKGAVVAGDVENDGNHAFESVTAEVSLYDENEVEDDILDSTVQQTSRDSLDPGATWQWAVTFRDTPLPEIDYYAVTARGEYD